MAANHTAELDSILDNIQDLSVAASEDGLDEQATTLEEVLETLRTIDFSDGESESEEDAEDQD